MATRPDTMFIYTAYPDNGEPYVIEASMRDILKWERSSPKGRPLRKAEDLASSVAENTYEIGWLAATRLGLYRGTKSDFEESVSLIGGDALTPVPEGEDANEGDGLVDPTLPAA